MTDCGIASIVTDPLSSSMATGNAAATASVVVGPGSGGEVVVGAGAVVVGTTPAVVVAAPSAGLQAASVSRPARSSELRFMEKHPPFGG
jgi:hypothetical protein